MKWEGGSGDVGYFFENISASQPSEFRENYSYFGTKTPHILCYLLSVESVTSEVMWNHSLGLVKSHNSFEGISNHANALEQVAMC